MTLYFINMCACVLMGAGICTCVFDQIIHKTTSPSDVYKTSLLSALHRIDPLTNIISIETNKNKQRRIKNLLNNNYSFQLALYITNAFLC